MFGERWAVNKIKGMTVLKCLNVFLGLLFYEQKLVSYPPKQLGTGLKNALRNFESVVISPEFREARKGSEVATRSPLFGEGRPSRYSKPPLNAIQ